MEMTLDNETRSYFDGKFETIHDHISDNRVELAKVSQEVKDLKSNGYFVKPKDCRSLHEMTSERLRSMSRRQAMMVGGLVVISVVAPFILHRIFG